MAATRIAKSKRLATPKLDGEKLYVQLRQSGPAISNVEAEEIEAVENDPRRHMWRRAAVAVQAMSGETLCSKIDADHESAVTFAELAIGIRDYVAMLRAQADFLDAAQVRIELALCAREDHREVLAEADEAAAQDREAACR